MTVLTANLGALSLRLTGVEFARMPAFEGSPLLRLPDGTEVQAACHGGRRILLIDHRRDVSNVARVEHWTVAESPEAPVSTLLVLADARPPAATPA